jgi:hypothetical protein
LLLNKRAILPKTGENAVIDLICLQAAKDYSGLVFVSWPTPGTDYATGPSALAGETRGPLVSTWAGSGPTAPTYTENGIYVGDCLSKISEELRWEYDGETIPIRKLLGWAEDHVAKW